MQNKLIVEKNIKIINEKEILKFYYYQTFLDFFKKPKSIEIFVEKFDFNKMVVKTSLSSNDGLIVDKNDLVLVRIMYGKGVGVIIEIHHASSTDEDKLMQNEAFVSMNLKLKHLFFPKVKQIQ